MRGRQLHDHWHVLTKFSTSVPDELGLQAFTLGRGAAPVSALIVGGGLIFAAMKKPWLVPECMYAIQRGFALGLQTDGPVIGLHYSEHWEKSLEEVRKMVGMPEDGEPIRSGDKVA